MGIRMPGILLVAYLVTCAFTSIVMGRSISERPEPEIAQLFHLIDVDCDDVLSATEIKVWARLNGASASAATLIQLAGDGGITLDDLTSRVPTRLRGPIVHGTTPAQIHTSMVSDNQLVVTWVTGDPTKTSTLQFSTDTNKTTVSVSGTTRTYTAGGWKGVVHEALFPVLPSASKAVYRVGDADGGWSPYFTVVAPRTLGTKPENRPLTYATFGDMGTYIPLGYAVCEMMEEDHAVNPFDVILHIGDLAYASVAVTVDGVDQESRLDADQQCLTPSDVEQLLDGSDPDSGGEQEFVWDIWTQQIQPLAANIPYITAVGNHERFYNFSAYLTRFNNPAPWGGKPSTPENNTFWFSFNHGLVHFVCMSTEHDYTPGSEQYQWLVRDLEQASAPTAREQVPWIVFTGHRPMYCSDESEKDQHWPGAHFQQTIEPLFTKYGVDLYLCGHMHIYERIHPVLNGTATDKGNVYKDPKGIPQVVQGNAGVFEDISFVDPKPAWSAVRKSKIGYGRMQVHNATHLYYEARELDSKSTGDDFWLIRTRH